jgi:hypothetical protein
MCVLEIYRTVHRGQREEHQDLYGSGVFYATVNAHGYGSREI